MDRVSYSLITSSSLVSLFMTVIKYLAYSHLLSKCSILFLFSFVVVVWILLNRDEYVFLDARSVLPEFIMLVQFSTNDTTATASAPAATTSASSGTSDGKTEENDTKKNNNMNNNTKNTLPSNGTSSLNNSLGTYRDSSLPPSLRVDRPSALSPHVEIPKLELNQGYILWKSCLANYLLENEERSNMKDSIHNTYYKNNNEMILSNRKNENENEVNKHNISKDNNTTDDKSILYRNALIQKQTLALGIEGLLEDYSRKHNEIVKNTANGIKSLVLLKS